MINEENLERHADKIIIRKIIKTKDLTAEKCNEYSAYVKNKKKVTKYTDINNNPFWTGFTQNYIYSYKKKQRQKNKKTEKYKEYDKDFTKIKSDETESQIIKLTHLYKDDPNAKPKYIDTFLMPDLNLICLAGTKEGYISSRDEIINFLIEEKIEYDEINLTHDFLLWSLWKMSKNLEIHPNLKLLSFDALDLGPKYIGNRVENDERNPPCISTIGGGTNYPYTPICFGLFNSRELNGFNGEFEHNNNNFQANIFIEKNTYGIENMIHVKWGREKGSIQFSKKMELVLPFIFDLTRSIKLWGELPDIEQEPDEEYLDSLWQRYKEDFDDTKDNFIKFKKKYCDKEGAICKNKFWEDNIK